MPDDALIDLLGAAAQRQKWPWFRGPWNLNLWALRSADRVSDDWDDVIGCVYEDDDGRPFIRRWVGTTDPGRPFRLEPMRAQGTAIMTNGCHRLIWQPGLHRDDYRALVQVGDATWWRDTNRDGVLDMTGPTNSGRIGLNLHHGGNARVVGRHSAACQVVRNPDHLLEILALVDLQAAAGLGARVTYKLHDVTLEPDLEPLLHGIPQ